MRTAHRDASKAKRQLVPMLAQDDHWHDHDDEDDEEGPDFCGDGDEPDMTTTSIFISERLATEKGLT